MRKILVLGLLGVVWVYSSGAAQSTYTSQSIYDRDRNELIAQNEARAFDADIKLNDAETAANTKLLALRDSMIAKYIEVGFFPPSRDLHKSIDHIESTKLYRILRQMPKGGFLHMHASAVREYDWLIDKMISLPEMYVYWEEDNDRYTKGQIAAYNVEDVPAGFVSAGELSEAEPQFKTEMLDLLTLTTETDQDTMSIWDEFDKVFQRIGGFYEYQPVFKEFHREIFTTLLEDHIQHVEPRQIIFGGLYDLEHGRGYYNEDSVIHIFRELEQEIKDEYPEFTMKLIYTDLRFRNKTRIKESLASAYRLKARYPEIIKGFDLVAHEDVLNSTYHYLDSWLAMDSLETVYGVDMPLYFHNGESDWFHNKNLYDAVLLDSKRIGHGLNLGLFPGLVDRVVKNHVCLEVSPLSNQILGYVEDLRIHPAHSLIRRGVQITISSDDPGIYQYQDLTHDYWSIMLAWELDLKSLKKLSMNGLSFSSLSDKEKEIAFEFWQQDWDQFIELVNTEL